MKFLQQIILLVAVISAVRGKTLSKKSDLSGALEFDDVIASKDLLRKTPKKFVPSLSKDVEEDPKKLLSTADVESPSPTAEGAAIEVPSDVSSAFLRPIFREDLPLGIFRSSFPRWTDRRQVETLKEIEEELVNKEENKNLVLVAQDSAHLHSLSGELGPLGLSKHEESLIGGFRPLDWE